MPNHIKPLQASIFKLQTNYMLDLKFIAGDLTTNVLDQSPSTNEVIIYNGVKYGQPSFRLKQRGDGALIPFSDAFWFTKVEGSEDYHINAIVEVYREEEDVHPLIIKDTSVILTYTISGEAQAKNMEIIQSPMMAAVNVLMEIHTKCLVRKSELSGLMDALAKAAVVQINITSELWWQRPKSEPSVPPSPPPPPPKQQALMEKFKGIGSQHKLFMGAHFLSTLDFKPALVTAAALPKDGLTPTKIVLNPIIALQYEKNNFGVYGAIFEDLTNLESVWRFKSLIKEGKNFMIYYRANTQPDTFSFLPQVYRIAVNEYSGEPRVLVSMLAGSNPEKIEEYRIRANFQIKPYFHPRAKKDLYDTLNGLTKGIISYCKITFDNFSSAVFSVNEVEMSDIMALNGNITIPSQGIDAVNGFSLNIECSLESFDLLKRKIVDGFTVGQITFTLVQKTIDGESEIQSQPIPVELNLRELVGIPVAVEPNIDSTSEEKPIPTGIHLYNENKYPVHVGGVELCLLSEINDTVYDTDTEIGNDGKWPSQLLANKQNIVDVNLNKNDVDELSNPAYYWSSLLCEPFGVALADEPEVIMGKIIDYASGDPQIWNLQIECLVLESFDGLDEADKATFNGLSRLSIEVRQDDQTPAKSIVLSKAKPQDSIQMSRSISKILQTQQLTERAYQYRYRTAYITEEKPWTEWKQSESTSANYLIIYPQPK